jgi:hypothetical protein
MNFYSARKENIIREPLVLIFYCVCSRPLAWEATGPRPVEINHNLLEHFKSSSHLLITFAGGDISAISRVVWYNSINSQEPLDSPPTKKCYSPCFINAIITEIFDAVTLCRSGN